MPLYTSRLLPRRLWLRHVLAVAAALCAALGLVHEAEAATAKARLRWLPSTGATSYNLYVRAPGVAYGAPVPVTNPTPGGDGSVSAVLTYTVAAGGTNYFAVSAVGPNSSESGFSRELTIGAVNPCRLDECVSRTSCTFGNKSNGTSCDDELFCDGAEVCVQGACVTAGPRDCGDAIACTVDECDETLGLCTHNGPPGCCLACDTSDPCLAHACAIGDCRAGDGLELEVNRVRLLYKAAGVKLAAKGAFTPEVLTDPTITGALIELHAQDGAVLYSSAIPGYAFKSGTDHGRYRFTASRAESEISNGLTRLDVRSKKGSWLITLKGETTLLQTTFLEPNLTWLVRFGDQCARRLSMECNQTQTHASCR